MKPKLISFKTCPFVQRSVIALLEKNISFDIEYIDLANKPEWFLEISPMGKVPLLKINDAILFESSVINEYLDEVYPPALHPADALQKAMNRALIEFNANILMVQFQLWNAKDKETFEEKQTAMHGQLQKLEQMFGDGDYVNGDKIHLVDLASAPLLQKINILRKHFLPTILQDFPKITAWSERLLVRPSVINSTVPEIEELFIGNVKSGGGYINQLKTVAI